MFNCYCFPVLLILIIGLSILIGHACLCNLSLLISRVNPTIKINAFLFPLSILVLCQLVSEKYLLVFVVNKDVPLDADRLLLLGLEDLTLGEATAFVILSMSFNLYTVGVHNVPLFIC